MGIDLENQHGGYFGCSSSRWVVYRDVARAFGWEPAGTLPPRAPVEYAEPWTGSYDDTARQRVSEADAHSLAEALERALQSDALSAVLRRAWGFRSQDEEVWQIQCAFDREQLLELSRFCRGGEFEIS